MVGYTYHLAVLFPYRILHQLFFNIKVHEILETLHGCNTHGELCYFTKVFS